MHNGGVLSEPELGELFSQNVDALLNDMDFTSKVLGQQPHLAEPAAPPGAPSPPLPFNLFTSAEHARQCAAMRWLTSEEVYELLTHGVSTYRLPLETRPPNKPGAGRLFFFSKSKVRHFRSDGLEWRVKKNGFSLAESAEKLTIGHVKVSCHAMLCCAVVCYAVLCSVKALSCYYSVTADGSLSRRIYSRLDDKDLVLVIT